MSTSLDTFDLLSPAEETPTRRRRPPEHLFEPPTPSRAIRRSGTLIPPGPEAFAEAVLDDRSVAYDRRGTVPSGPSVDVSPPERPSEDRSAHYERRPRPARVTNAAPATPIPSSRTIVPLFPDQVDQAPTPEPLDLTPPTDQPASDDLNLTLTDAWFDGEAVEDELAIAPLPAGDFDREPAPDTWFGDDDLDTGEPWFSDEVVSEQFGDEIEASWADLDSLVPVARTMGPDEEPAARWLERGILLGLGLGLGTVFGSIAVFSGLFL